MTGYTSGDYAQRTLTEPMIMTTNQPGDHMFSPGFPSPRRDNRLTPKQITRLLRAIEEGVLVIRQEPGEIPELAVATSFDFERG